MMTFIFFCMEETGSSVENDMRNKRRFEIAIESFFFF